MKMIAVGLVSLILMIVIILLPLADELAPRDGKDRPEAVPAPGAEERATEASELDALCRRSDARRPGERGSVGVDVLVRVLLIAIVSVPFIVALGID